MSPGKTFRDYVTEYQTRTHTEQLDKLSTVLGLQSHMHLLISIMKDKVTMSNINEYGRLDELESKVDRAKARKYFERRDGKPMSIPKVNVHIHKLLQDFILTGGFDLEIPDD